MKLNMLIKENKFFEFIRFAIVGGVATLIHMMVYTILNMKITYNFSYTIGYIISFIFNFFASNYFTFNTKPSKSGGIRFAASHIFNYILQIVLLNIFIYIGISSKIAPFFVLAICIPINYFLVRLALKKKVSSKSNELII